MSNQVHQIQLPPLPPPVETEEDWTTDCFSGYNPQETILTKNVIRGPLIGQGKKAKKQFRHAERLRHNKLFEVSQHTLPLPTVSNQVHQIQLPPLPPPVEAEEDWNTDCFCSYNPQETILTKNVIRGPLIGQGKKAKKQFRQAERLRHNKLTEVSQHTLPPPTVSNQIHQIRLPPLPPPVETEEDWTTDC